MHECSGVNNFVPIAISQATASREYRAMGHVGDYENSYKVGMILMRLMHAQKNYYPLDLYVLCLDDFWTEQNHKRFG